MIRSVDLGKLLASVAVLLGSIGFALADRSRSEGCWLMCLGFVLSFGCPLFYLPRMDGGTSPLRAIPLLGWMIMVLGIVSFAMGLLIVMHHPWAVSSPWPDRLVLIVAAVALIFLARGLWWLNRDQTPE